MGKYEALGRHLSQQGEKQLKIGFEEIEDVLGFSLPQSAHDYRAWWAEDPRHVQAFDGWLSVGWKVSLVDFANESVEFTKDGEEQPGQPRAEPKSLAGPRSRAYEFESTAQKIMSKHLGVALYPGEVQGVKKLFDYVSDDRKIVGDAKYYTMVRGKSLPPAKFSVIAEHVWLLENTDAKTKFLVFGNDRRVPEEWLKRYGNMVKGVEFYFIDENNKLEILKEVE